MHFSVQLEERPGNHDTKYHVVNRLINELHYAEIKELLISNQESLNPTPSPNIQWHLALSDIYRFLPRTMSCKRQ